MRIAKLMIVCSIFVCLVAPSSYGADVAKIGVVDFQKILTTSSAGKKAQAEINKKGKAMESELKEKGTAIEKQRESYERESLVMTKAMRDEKERELRIMINDFKSLQKKYMADFKAYEQRIVKRIRDEILDLVDGIGKKEGYLLVVEKREGGLLYFPSSIDVTDQVIRAYNEKMAN